MDQNSAVLSHGTGRCIGQMPTPISAFNFRIADPQSSFQTAFPVLSGPIGHMTDQLVQFRKQKLQNGRLVRLSVAKDEIDSWRSTP